MNGSFPSGTTSNSSKYGRSGSSSTISVKGYSYLIVGVWQNLKLEQMRVQFTPSRPLSAACDHDRAANYANQGEGEQGALSLGGRGRGREGGMRGGGRGASSGKRQPEG
jgi:hypothetical protein